MSKPDAHESTDDIELDTLPAVVAKGTERPLLAPPFVVAARQNASPKFPQALSSISTCHAPAWDPSLTRPLASASSCTSHSLQTTQSIESISPLELPESALFIEPRGNHSNAPTSPSKRTSFPTLSLAVGPTPPLRLSYVRAPTNISDHSREKPLFLD